MKLPPSAHLTEPWRIHEIAYDFKLVDVWSLPTPGGPDDFPRLVRLFTSIDPSNSASLPVRALFAFRYALGNILRLDDPETGLGSRVTTLRERLPDELLERSPTAAGAIPFTPLYETDTEYAAEVANRTMHGVIHLGWLPDGAGSYRGQMAILVKPNGLLGTSYLAAIKPFRHLVVYPTLLRETGSKWQAPAPDEVAAAIH